MVRMLSFPLSEGGFDEVSVCINGRAVQPSVCRVSALPFNIWWSGKQRDIRQTELAGIISFVMDEPAEFIVSCKEMPNKAIVRPLNAGIVPTVQDGKATFTITRCGQYVLELPNEHTCIHIFANPPKDFGVYGAPTHYFGAGVHEVGKLILQSGDRVFIDEGAYVKGVLYGKGVEDVKIYGYGRLDGGMEERKNGRCYEEDTNGCIKLYDSKEIVIDGVMLTDSAVWVLNVFRCEQVCVEGVKIVGHWRYNTDGIDIVNSSKVQIKNSFIRAFDDAITLKGIAYYPQSNVEDITVEGCVLWCGWGRTLEIGLETVAEKYENIRFCNCDLIHNSSVALDIQSGDYAEISHIYYQDIRVEYSQSTTPEVMENPLGVEYTGYGKLHVPTLIKICTQPYALEGEEFAEYVALHEALRQGRYACTHDICFDNITVYLEEGVPFPDIVMDVKAPATLGKVEIKNITIKRY